MCHGARSFPLIGRVRTSKPKSHFRQKKNSKFFKQKTRLKNESSFDESKFDLRVAQLNTEVTNGFA